MTRLPRLLAFSALFGAGAVLVSATSDAGQTYGDFAYCTSFGGTGNFECMGNYRGFRNNSDPKAYQVLEYINDNNGGGPYVAYYAELAGTYYSCTIYPSNSLWADAAHAALVGRS